MGILHQKERPIIFSGPMIRAILNGTKTQTRRIIKKPGICPYGSSGDRLWVREAFNSDWCDHVIYKADGESAKEAGYTAEPKWRPSIHMPRWASRSTLEVTGVRVEILQSISDEDATAEGVKGFRTSDTWLCVTRDGSTYETFMEPTDETKFELDYWKHRPGRYLSTARDEFKILWDKFDGKRATWDSNPRVWVISFKRLEGGAP